MAKTLLGPDATQRALDDATRLSRFLGPDPLYKFLDVLYHYPAFLFHRSAAETPSAVEGPASFREYARDYAHTLDLLLRSGFGTRNLGARLRAFRMQHDLTLIETADLLDLSKSELHRLERSERRPSPRTRYRILRLLTLPLDCHPELVEGPACPSGHGFSRADTWAPLSPGGKRAASLRRQRAGWVGQRLGWAGTRGSRVAGRGARTAALKALLSLPPPDSSTLRPFDSSDSPLARLRSLWLAGPLKTKELARALGVSPPHLIPLLRGDRRPSRALTDRIQHLFP